MRQCQSSCSFANSKKYKTQALIPVSDNILLHKEKLMLVSSASANSKLMLSPTAAGRLRDTGRASSAD